MNQNKNVIAHLREMTTKADKALDDYFGRCRAHRCKKITPMVRLLESMGMHGFTEEDLSWMVKYAEGRINLSMDPFDLENDLMIIKEIHNIITEHISMAV